MSGEIIAAGKFRIYLDEAILRFIVVYLSLSKSMVKNIATATLGIFI
jgi:hypothetical protein